MELVYQKFINSSIVNPGNSKKFVTRVIFESLPFSTFDKHPETCII